MQTKKSGFRVGPGDSDIRAHRWSGQTYALENLRLSHTLNELELLALLNGEAIYPRTDSRRLLHAPGKDTRTAEEQLRELVDEWIDSAVDENGTEHPAGRCHKRDGLARRAFSDYSKSLRILASDSGSIVLSGAPPQLPFTEDEPVYGGLGDKRDKRDKRNHSEWLDHRQSAQAFFVSLMLSPLAQRIAKCKTDGCGKYFLIGQPNHEYEGGTHCPVHAKERDKQIRAKFNQDKRDLARQRLYETCAKHFGGGFRKHDWRTNRPFLQDVLGALNMQIAADPDLRSIYPAGIKSSWFARKENIDGLHAALTPKGGTSHAQEAAA